jgi:hypothetical protein
MATMTQDSTRTGINEWSTPRVPKGYTYRLAGMGFRPSDADITGDIERLVRSLITNSTDQSNINLHFDELYGELMLKLAQILNRRDLFFDDRQKFFGFLKVSLDRHRKTLIQRFAFTMKRTGIKPSKNRCDAEPIEHVRLDHHTHDPHKDDPHKAVKIELDDDEHGVSNFFGVESGREEADAFESVEKFVVTYLTPIEAVVVRQEMEPNDAAYVYAYVENDEGDKTGKFKIRDRHKAQGVGLELGAYKKILGRIRLKMETIRKGHNMSENTELHQQRLAELQLCEIFNVQVPAHVDPVVKRRCFTIAARDNYDKVTKEVASLLEQVGAYVPKKHGDVMACFGVLWEANHRGCRLCALEETCKTRAANVGLADSDFHIDKRLLATKAAKTPMILPKIEPPQDGV